MSGTRQNYFAAWARDGAMNHATTRTPKLTNATAIISGLLRLKLRDPLPLNEV